MRLELRRPDGVYAAEKMSVTVLPFADLTRNGNNQHLVDGITEDLITDLSMSPEFFIITRPTTSQFKDGRNDLRSVVQQLGARYVVVAVCSGTKIRFAL